MRRLLWRGWPSLICPAPIEWLPTVPWTIAVDDAVLGLLPSLLGRLGTAKVVRKIEQVWPQLSTEAQTALREFCRDEEIDFDPVQANEVAVRAVASAYTPPLQVNPSGMGRSRDTVRPRRHRFLFA